MDDDQIIELFFARDEDALAELDGKYGKECRRISANILGNRMDAEECVNDAYLGVWNTVPPNRPRPLLTYLCRIVRNLSIKRYYENTATKRNSRYDVALDEIEECLSSPSSVEAEYDNGELARAIESFLATLTAENRVIFMRRYWFSDTYAEIARRVGLTEKNVSVRLTRLRKQMQIYLNEKGISI